MKQSWKEEHRHWIRTYEMR